MNNYHINITEYFDRTADKYSDMVAVIENDREITFGELFKQVKKLSNEISCVLQGKINCIVGVLLPKSINSVIADLAILYSGNAYMNMDVTNPHQRLNYILNQSNPDLVISMKKYQYDTENSQSWCLYFDDDYNKVSTDDMSFEDARTRLIDTDPSCVINTSGSTGTPKAVILNHRSFIDFIESVRHEGFIQDNEVIASLSPTVFDIYSFELCMLMTWGCKIVVVPEMFAAFPAKLLQLMEQRKVTYIFWVPTIMVNIANMDLLSLVSLPSLRMAWFAGEVFPTAKFNYWKSHLPNCRFVNFYGPIEITLDCLFHEVKEDLTDETPIPIGKPFRNTAILVLNEDNQLSDEGELCIRGSSLAMGYYNNHEKTQSAFVQNPLNTSYPELIYRTGDIVKKKSDGNYVYAGRKDTLIKRMGYRIELSEIEHVIVDTLKIVKNCCVIYLPNSKDIVLVYESDCELSVRYIQNRIKQVLPKYMIPTKFIYLELLPRNANGKIDRNMLKQQINNI